MWGWGSYSAITSIQAATKPLTITDLMASVVSNGDYRVDWSLADDQGSELLETHLQVWNIVTEQWITRSLFTPATSSWQVPMESL
jgi:hypothetical protein